MEFSVNDATYWYERVGKGPTIMLLHGFTGSGATWSHFAEQWQDDFQILMVDLPGHGRTVVDTPHSMEMCCCELDLLCEHLHLSSVHLVGYSMGGRTALTFAQLYPHRVLSLILESASPGLATIAERQQRIQQDEKLAQKLEKQGVQAFVDYWETIPLFETQKKLSIAKQRAIRQERLNQTKTGLAQSLRTMGTGTQPPLWDSLRLITMPVLLLAGMLDQKFIQLNEAMQERLPNGQFIKVPGAGHAIHVEQTDFFGKLVMEFIKNNDVKTDFNKN